MVACSSFKPFSFADDYASRQDGDVFQHFLAAVAEARSLDCANLQLATQTVDNQRRQSLTVYVFCNHQERTAGLYGRFQDGQEVFQVGNLLIVNQDVRVLHHALHFLRIRYEIGRKVATVELHALNHADSRVGSFGFFNRDDAVFRNLAHGVGYQLADNRVIVGRYGSHLLDFLVVVAYGLGLALDGF